MFAGPISLGLNPFRCPGNSWAEIGTAQAKKNTTIILKAAAV
jgi:hypothetical protein